MLLKLSFKNFNFSKLPSSILILPKSGIVDVSYQFKSDSAEKEVYNILVADFLKWTNILGHPKREKDKQIWTRVYYKRIHGFRELEPKY